VASEVEFLAGRASELAPGLGTKSDWLRQAYETVKVKVPKGVDPEPQMAEFLHDRCRVLKSRADGIQSLAAGVTKFRASPLIPAEVLAVNRRRLREHGGLTDDLKRELGQVPYSDERYKQVQRIQERTSAQRVSDTDG
jgi:hypothetical protein